MIYSESKILVVVPDIDDYLSLSILHGLKSLTSSEEVVDYPKYKSLYKDNCSNSTYGKGFTIFGLLPEEDVDRWEINQKVADKKFDLIIFSDIHRTFGVYLELLPYLRRDNTIILDGADTPQMYPFAGKWWRYPPYWFVPKAHDKFLYFKREWTPDTIHNLWYQVIPAWLSKYIPAPKNLHPISFAIPSEKIVQELPVKTKLFPKHIVDPEVASQTPGSLTSYVFDAEADYYKDLQVSKFGITTKRSGWDCLRHYEIAANGCVPCFRDLDEKPSTCAPHGLNETNCIIYHNYKDLMNQINNLKDDEYADLQVNAWNWAKKNTTLERAKEILKVLELTDEKPFLSVKYSSSK